MLRAVWVPLLITAVSVAASAEGDEGSDDVAPPRPHPAAAVADIHESVQGEWVLYRDTPKGRFMTIKDHRGDHTVVTTYDPENRPVTSHRSDYRIDATGSVPVFRYRNKVVLIGPNAGEKDDSDSAYVFRIHGDTFYEVHGLLPDDQGKPTLIIWERLHDNPIPKTRL